MISKIVIRWHGYMAAKTYAIKTSFSGFHNTFITYNTYDNSSTQWDRIDMIYPKINISTKFFYLRLEIYEPIICNPSDSTACTRRLDSTGPIYGIRELEVWAASQKAGMNRIFHDLSHAFSSYCFETFNLLDVYHFDLHFINANYRGGTIRINRFGHL